MIGSTAMIIGRFARWCLSTLKKTWLGIGGIALLVVFGLFVAGALVAAPMRWYLIGVAGALLLLCGGLLALSYVGSVLNRLLSDQNKKVVDMRKQTANMNKAVAGLNKEVSAMKDTLAKTNALNSPLFQRFNRRLTNEDLQHFTAKWVPKLELEVTTSALGYIAHRICLSEDTCLGRMAGNIEDMLLRILIARSIKEPGLDVLEIGTLFGVSIAILYDNCRGLSSDLHITVIDPLQGYYDQPSDPVTGMPVTRDMFVHNMRRMSIPESDYTIIPKLSTEDEAIEQASRRRYNLLIIDGDHSYAGVKHDFDTYRHLVKRAGYIVFDNYDDPNFPGVKDFVDKEVAGLPELDFVGTDGMTALFRVTKQHTFWEGAEDAT